MGQPLSYSTNLFYLCTINPKRMERSPAPTIQKRRIDSIDLFKGIAIIVIAWKHTIHPQCLDLVNVSSLFFIISGIFIKDEPFLPFLRKKIRTILVPFLFFYLLSYLARIVFYIGHHRTLCGFDWGILWDLFTISDKAHYLSVNIPLWFLVCLFVMEIIFWGLNRILKETKARTYVLLAIIAVLYLFFEPIENWRTPLMLNTAIECLPYFIMGNLFGLAISHYLIEATRPRFFIAVISIVLFTALQYLPFDISVLPLFKSLSLFMALLAMLSYVEGNQSVIARFVRTFGESSLLIMGVHVIILAPLQPIATAITGSSNLLAGAIALTLTLLVIYLLIPVVNKYIPWAVGKKK